MAGIGGNTSSNVNRKGEKNIPKMAKEGRSHSESNSSASKEVIYESVKNQRLSEKGL